MKKVSSLEPSIMIEGDNEFIDATNEALMLVRDLPTFHKVKPFLAIIKQGSRSEINVFTSQPTFSVGRQTWKGGCIWYGSCIIHDACHSKLYHQHRQRILGVSFTLPHHWTLKSGERACLRVQLQALREMPYDTEYFQEVIRQYLIDPTYFATPYAKRDW